MMYKYKKILCFFLSSFFLISVNAQEPKPQSVFGELFAGPSSADNHDEWLNNMKKWRAEKKKTLNFNDSEYLHPQLAWIKNTFMYAQVMAHDRYLYNETTGKYTVDHYLDDVKKRYGGLDAVLIWPTYPNIGVDNRNQYDLVSAMPGGTEGIKQMIKDFKKRNVRVFFPIMIWDNGTRDIGISISSALAKEMKELGADGLNGDTMQGVTEDFKNAYDSLSYPIALQPEVFIKDLKMVEWNTMSWGYYWKCWGCKDYEYQPGVSVYKWLEPRHQVHVTNRWAIDKTDDLQVAFFNGIGYNAWENIWGIWNQIPERYAETIRRIGSIYRTFPDVWSSADWEPYTPVMQKGVFASKFPGLDKTVYTLINRDSIDKKGMQLKLPFREGVEYYDLWNGEKLIPEQIADTITLSFTIEPRGFGCVLAIQSYAVTTSLKTFLQEINSIAKKPLNNISDLWKPLPQKIVPIKKTKAATKTPDGMVLIPAVKNYDFISNGVMIEGDDLPDAVGIQHSWQNHPSRSQQHMMNIASFYIDVYPVTNKQYKKFIDATHYHPKDDYNFLKYWQNGTYMEGDEDKPVTWISIEDARAYAAWAGKRLPHEWEWQYAAQGMDGRLYPWGKKDSTLMPLPDTSRDMRKPTNVTAFPQGASNFGLIDLIGNVWQWTDEYQDDHTRAAIVKGGSYFRAQTSFWYFPQAYELNKYSKYLLMSPGIDRAATIGFRCVVDSK